MMLVEIRICYIRNSWNYKLRVISLPIAGSY